MSEQQLRDIRQLRRLYLGRLGDVLRQRQAINAQLRSAVPSKNEGEGQAGPEYLKVRACSTPCAAVLSSGLRGGAACPGGVCGSRHLSK